MKHTALQELYVKELKDLYNSETQLIKALPKMANAASSDDLQNAFEDHLRQTREHANRLEKILGELNESVKGAKCKGMEGIVEEGSELMDEDFEAEVLDAALIGAAQRAEHYEIAGYGCARTYANLLGQPEAASLLEKTLEEEKETDQKLTEIAEAINIEAVEKGEREEEEEDTAKVGRRRSARARA